MSKSENTLPSDTPPVNQAPIAPDKPSEKRAKEEQDKIEKAVVKMFEHQISFNEFLGFEVQKLAPDSVEIGFNMRPELIGHFLFGRLHGGVISAVLDATGGLAVMWGMAEKHIEETAEQTLNRFAQLGTIDLRVDYLRSGLGERFTASARVVRLGRRVANTQMTLTNQDDRLIATANGTYIVS